MRDFAHKIAIPGDYELGGDEGDEDDEFLHISIMYLVLSIKYARQVRKYSYQSYFILYI